MKTLKYLGLAAPLLLLAACGQMGAPEVELKVLDNVQNDVTTLTKIVTVQRGSSAPVTYSINATNGDGQNGCNAGDDSPATVTPNIPSAATGVTKTPSSVTFNNCTDGKSVSFAAKATAALGDYEITVSVSDSNTSGGSYNLNPAKFMLRVVAATPSDTTPPVIEAVVTGTLRNNGWYTSDVALNWSVSDLQSTISSRSGCDEVNITSDQAATTYTCTATSAGGTSSNSISIKRDATAPTLNPTVLPNPVLLNGNATASAGAADGGSDLASSACDRVDTSTVGGSQSVECRATDNAGNSGSSSAFYSVQFKFGGLQEPYAGPTRAFKLVSVIPLKWEYTDVNGNAFDSANANPTVTRSSLVQCGGTDTDGAEAVAAPGASSYQYDALTKTWQYNLSTKGLSAGCYNLVVSSGQAERATGMQINLRK